MPTTGRGGSPPPRSSSRPWSTTHHVNDYAHFCLGRALSKTGDATALVTTWRSPSNLRPDRGDYRYYRERLDAA